MTESNRGRIKVLLVSPKSYEERFDQKLIPYRFFPYSIVYLVNYVRKHRLCEVDYMDLVVDSPDDLLRRVGEEHFDLIGFTSSAEARFVTIDLIRRVREKSPSSQIVTGGSFFSNTAEGALAHVHEIDFVVRGEGEVTLAELVKQLNSGQESFEGIEGLSFRCNGSVVHNPPRRPVIDLDEFLIDYSLVHKPGYDVLFPLKNWEDCQEKQAFPIMLGRGCNNRCIFCTHRLFAYRVVKIDSVLEQISLIKKRFNTRYFMFTDPSFCERTSFVKELCGRLVQEKFDIEWYCEGRADIPLDLLSTMRMAGCISIDFALESGSPRVLRALNKRLDPTKVVSFARECRRLGIRASYFTMISCPGEGPQDFEMTTRAMFELSRLGLTTSVAPLMIYPGTDLEALARDRKILPDDFSWYDESYSCGFRFITPREEKMPHYIEGMTEGEITAFLDKAREIQSLARFSVRSSIGRDLRSAASAIPGKIAHIVTQRSFVEFAEACRTAVRLFIPYGRFGIFRLKLLAHKLIRQKRQNRKGIKELA